jgi:hypothetical protein
MSDWNVAPVDDTLLRQTPRVTDDDLPAGAPRRSTTPSAT